MGRPVAATGRQPDFYRVVSMDRDAVVPRFGATLRRLRTEQGLSLRGLGERAHRAKSHLHDLETGRKSPTPAVAAHLDRVLRAGGRLAELGPRQVPAPAQPSGDEQAAVELARRVEASDVSAETLDRIEQVVDHLAIGASSRSVTAALGYVTALVDARMTLQQRQRLLVAGGWLSLLAATLQIDLKARPAARANLGAAWATLIVGNHRAAVDLSRQAQAIAPHGSSAHIQATAQEGRAWARMQERSNTRAVLDRLERLTSSLPVPDRPEYHYRYDPDKAISYTATTLAWAGDPAAEPYARAVVADLAGGPRRRRAELARLDLGLALVAAGKPDEASAAATTAIESGWLVPSTWWRATEVLAGVEATGIREAADLRDVYEAHRPSR